MKNISGKVAVVTGASEGIGYGIAAALVQEGAQVAIIARSMDKLEVAARELSAQQGNRAEGKAHPFSADLMNPDAVRDVIKRVREQLGEIDILVNNVGAGTFKPLDMQSAQEADLPVYLPFSAAVAACHAVVPSMIERKCGHIVNLTSPAGFIPFPYMSPYTAARHAVVGLSNSLYYELEQHGVGSTLFCPSQVNTEYFNRNDADMGWYPKGSKLFPVLEPEQVGKQVIKAIRKNKREAIYPFVLWSFVRMYQLMPRTTIASMKLFGLWQPSAKRDG